MTVTEAREIEWRISERNSKKIIFEENRERKYEKKEENENEEMIWKCVKKLIIKCLYSMKIENWTEFIQEKIIAINVLKRENEESCHHSEKKRETIEMREMKKKWS